MPHSEQSTLEASAGGPGPASSRVGYVVKSYPRYSETFIVTEILAHEAAGLSLEIFSLRPPRDSHFQDMIARVRANVHYVPPWTPDLIEFWSSLQTAARDLPNLWPVLAEEELAAPTDLYQAVWLARAARRRGLEHLHAHFASSATTITRLAARLAGLPYSFTAHAKDIFHESVTADDLRRKLNDAAAVITVSDYNVDYLRATYGPAASGVHRLYNGLELERFPYAEPRHRLPLVVGVGRLVEKKGFADLIEACGVLHRQGRHFSCQIIGDGELKSALRAQIDALGLTDIVQLIGPRPQAEIVNLVQSAAVFAAPCVVGADGNRDGLPTVLLEAMALGTPCISTDVTGIPEVIEHGRTGLIVQQHCPDDLAAAIARLLDSEDERVALARQARRRIEADFDSQCNSSILRQLFATGSPVTAGGR